MSLPLARSSQIKTVNVFDVSPGSQVGGRAMVAGHAGQYLRPVTAGDNDGVAGAIPEVRPRQTAT